LLVKFEYELLNELPPQENRYFNNKINISFTIKKVFLNNKNFFKKWIYVKTTDLYFKLEIKVQKHQTFNPKIFQVDNDVHNLGRVGYPEQYSLQLSL
jgi:hypothetical protein